MKLGVAERMFGCDGWEEGDDVGEGALRALSVEVVETPSDEGEERAPSPPKRLRARRVSYK